MQLPDGWIRDGHSVSPVLEQDKVDLEVHCPHFPADQYHHSIVPTCGGSDVCALIEAISDVGAGCMEIGNTEKIRDFPLEVDYRYLPVAVGMDETVLWLRPYIE